MHFQYGVTSNGSTAFTIEARSDLDGDSAVNVWGYLQPDSTGTTVAGPFGCPTSGTYTCGPWAKQNGSTVVATSAGCPALAEGEHAVDAVLPGRLLEGGRRPAGSLAPEHGSRIRGAEGRLRRRGHERERPTRDGPPHPVDH